MRILRTLREMHAQTRHWKAEREVISLVPTMGALHAGHGSLMAEADRRSQQVVVSIFVNPTQFGPGEDYDAYPRTWEADKAYCEEMGVAAIWAPRVVDLYPDGAATWVEETALSQGLEGEHRPGHMRGVTTVVSKLFNAVLPDVAVFGQKDAQQAAVIRRMTRDLCWPIEIVVAPTHREPDGLAMSSRNQYLSADERQAATAIYAGLTAARAACAAGEHDSAALVAIVRTRIVTSGGRPEYIAVNHPDTLAPLTGTLTGRALISLVAYYGKARLLDNIFVSPG
jgi:pantoate--beta-alanine ligase